MSLAQRPSQTEYSPTGQLDLNWKIRPKKQDKHPGYNRLASQQVPKSSIIFSVCTSVVIAVCLASVFNLAWPVWVGLAAALSIGGQTCWVWLVEGSRKGIAQFWQLMVWLALITVLTPLASITFTVLKNGIPGLVAPGFLASDMVGITGRVDILAAEGVSPVLGGIKHALIGTLVITFIAALISIPLGVAAAIWLVEYAKNTKMGKAVNLLVDVMTGIPSIVAGLCVSAIVMAGWAAVNGGVGCIFTPNIPQCSTGGKHLIGITASLALSLLMLPVVVRTTEQMLRVVSDDLREAAYALGGRKWRAITKVVLPTAARGIASGVTLAIARVAGETAPILLTAGFARSVNWNPFSGWMANLPVYIYTQLTSPIAPAAAEISQQRAWGAALVLVAIVMVLNLSARLISARFTAKANPTGRAKTSINK